MTKPVIDQKEYLKKYLRSDSDAKKKKKKIKVGSKNVKIIDDDIDLKNLRPMEDGEFDILNATEDAPQIVGIVDERGPVDFADKRRWKIIADDGEGNVAVSCSQLKSRDVENENVPDNVVSNKSKEPSKTIKRSQENGKSSHSPPRKSRKQSDDDLSPPRKPETRKKSKKRRKKSSSSDSTSSSSSSSSSDSSDSEVEKKRKHKSKKSSKNQRKSRTDDDSDLSPPRKRKDSEDLSPPRNRKPQNKSDSDLSPPRRSQKSSENVQKKRNNDSDLSPPRVRRRGGLDSDLSPPRRPQRDFRDRKERRNNDSDLSPPRKSRREDTKFSRRNRKSDSDISPPRRSNKIPSKSFRSKSSDSDLSPPRHRKSESRYRTDMQEKKSDFSRRHREKSPRRQKSRWNDDEKRSPSPQNDRRMKKTLDGKTAGLQDAQALREETLSHKKRETELFNKMSEEVSGRGRAAVLRDRKTGKRRDLEAEAADKREKEKKKSEIDEKYAKWGRGLKQVEDQNEKLKDDLYEMSKPLARYADDADLDARQRATEYAEDPMLAYIKDKQIKEGKREPDAPNYEGSFMPNRFGIKPGHRWDGVDRSNGYEKKWFEARNAKAAMQEEAYKWSTSDM